MSHLKNPSDHPDEESRAIKVENLRLIAEHNKKQFELGGLVKESNRFVKTDKYVPLEWER